MSLTQVHAGEWTWPSGDFQEIAVLSAAFDHLLAKHDFRPETWFERGLGEFRGFGFRSAEGEVFLISENIASPEYGLNLIVDSGALLRSGPQVLVSIAVTALVLAESDVTWMASSETVDAVRQRFERAGDASP